MARQQLIQGWVSDRFRSFTPENPEERLPEEIDMRNAGFNGFTTTSLASCEFTHELQACCEMFTRKEEKHHV